MPARAADVGRIDRDPADDTMLVSFSRASRLLDCSRQEVYILVRRHKLPTIKIGKMRRLEMPVLRRLISDHRQAATANLQEPQHPAA